MLAVETTLSLIFFIIIFSIIGLTFKILDKKFFMKDKKTIKSAKSMKSAENIKKLKKK